MTTYNLNIAPKITGKDVMRRLLAGIKSDAAFSQFCFDTFDKYPTQFLGFDPQNPPKDDKLPWIGTVLTGCQVADGFNAYLYNISKIGRASCRERV